MKKLSLALVCLISVAFFASCNDNVENPEPSIAFVSGEGYTSTDASMASGSTVMIGFNAAANTETNKALTSFQFTIAAGSEILSDTTIAIDNQTTYSYDAAMTLTGEGIVTFTGKITDADGETASASLDVTLTEENLVATPFEWQRIGGAAGQGLAEFGLQWTSNYKEVMATIKPLDGAKLYEFNNSVWGSITTESEKVAAFANATEIESFREVSANASQDYNFVIGTMYNGAYYLMNITKATVITATAGTTITITGNAK